MNAVVIGGSSGLGLVLAKQLMAEDYDVIVTGRKDPNEPNITFRRLDLSGPDLPQRLESFIAELPEVDMLIYAAGYYQEGRVTDLSESEIEEMLNVGARGLIYSLRAILKKQSKLPELITITSTSQWLPRKLEPIYNFVKAGAGHLTNSMAEDGRIGKAMVACPAGMKTPFWRDDPGRDMSEYLDPGWVAAEIMKARRQTYRYKYVRINRQPARVEEVEIR